MGCTGAFISPKGHLLTALHCVEVLLDPKVQQEVSTVRRWEFLFRENTVFTPRNTIYPQDIIKDMYVGSKSYDAEVLLLGKRYGVSYLDSYGAEDYAILKLQTTEETECLKIRETVPKSGEKLWSFGYPDAFNERNGESVQRWDDLELLVSNGPVRYNVIQGTTRILDAVLGTDLQGFSREMRAKAGKKNISAAIDIGTGMSGGPVVDRSGKINGVNARAFMRYGKTDKMNLLFTHGSFILNSIFSNLKKQDQLDILSCRD